MSKVSNDEIRQLGKLARLSLSATEMDALEYELSSILSHMENLSEVDTSNVVPMTHASTSESLRPESLRPDIAQPSLAVESVLASSSRIQDDCFSVPPVLPSGSSK